MLPRFALIRYGFRCEYEMIERCSNKKTLDTCIAPITKLGTGDVINRTDLLQALSLASVTLVICRILGL